MNVEARPAKLGSLIKAKTDKIPKNYDPLLHEGYEFERHDLANGETHFTISYRAFFSSNEELDKHRRTMKRIVERIKRELGIE